MFFLQKPNVILKKCAKFELDQFLTFREIMTSEFKNSYVDWVVFMSYIKINKTEITSLVIDDLIGRCESLSL